MLSIYCIEEVGIIINDEKEDIYQVTVLSDDPKAARDNLLLRIHGPHTKIIEVFSD